MSSDRKKNLLRAAFALFITVGCLLLALNGPTNGKVYPFIGAGLGAFLTIAYLRRAMQE